MKIRIKPWFFVTLLTLGAFFSARFVELSFSYRTGAFEQSGPESDTDLLAGTVTVRGYCYYTDQSGIQHPIKYAKVNLLDKTWYGISSLLSTTSTDIAGYYSFGSVDNVDEFGGTGTLDLYIEVVCDSDAVNVVSTLPISIWPYSGSSDVTWDVPNGAINIDYICDDSSMKGCWGIYHSIIQAYQETYTRTGYLTRKITVV